MKSSDKERGSVKAGKREGMTHRLKPVADPAEASATADKGLDSRLRGNDGTQEIIVTNAEKAARKLLGDVMPGYHDLFVEETITPTKIQTAMRAYRMEGKLQGLGNLFDLLLDSDDNLQSVVDVRKEALKQVTWSWDDALSDTQKEWYDRLLAAHIGAWVDEFIEAKLMGWQFHQIMWEQEGGLYVPDRLVSYKNLDLRISNRELALYDSKGNAVELPEEKFIRHVYKRPALHSIIRYYVFFGVAVNNWAQFTETYGKPTRIGSYEPNATSAEIDVLRRAVKALGTDQGAIISKNTEMDFKDFGGKYSSKALYEGLCQYVSSRVTKRILGQTLTTGEGDTGSYAQAKIHNLVREDIKAGDVRDFSRFVSEIIARAHAVNWGGATPQIWLELPQQVDVDKRIVIDTALLNAGLPMSQDHFYDTYGVDRPRDDQELMARSSESGAGDAMTHRLKPVLRPAEASGTSVVVANAENDKSLAKLQAEIRRLGSLEELKEYNPRWFISAWGRELGAMAVGEYINARQKIKGKKANAAGLPPIEWEWDETSIVMANGLRNQAMIVSGVRTKAALAELARMAEAVADAGGSFQDFISSAKLAGFEPENPAHWQTEFQTARVAAAAAGRWEELQADRDILPYLKYVTMGDDLVREEHRILHGTVAAVDDTFWDENYPPNGWNCRCDVEQLTAGEAEGEPRWNQPKPDYTPEKGFGGNSGKDGRLPGGAGDLYGEYAERAGAENSAKPVARRKWWNRILNADKDDKGVIRDRLGYPVDMNGNSVGAEAVRKAQEIWQQKDSATYIHAQGDKVTVVSATKGVVASVREYGEIEYRGQGREGFREW